MGLPQIIKPQSVLPLGPIDITSLLPLVERMSEAAWQAEDAIKENKFACFRHTKHVVFRFIPDNADAETFYANPSWTIWQHVLTPAMHAAIAGYGFREPVFPKAMFARLSAGQLIDRHVDGAGSNLCTHKIHIPLITNEDALFEAGGEIVHLAAGHAYEVNNIDVHSARNLGSSDRIHFIFEVFDAAMASARTRPALRAHG